MLKQQLVKTTTQSLNMFESMQVSLHLLQMQTDDLLAYITQEATLNPFLQIEDVEGERSDDVSAVYDFVQNTHTKAPSLREHLEEQIYLLFSGDLDNCNLAYILTEYLDENGYFSSDLTTISEEVGVKLSSIEKILKKLQTLEPIGVYAQNLSECLKIQCAEVGILDKAMEKVLDNLELFKHSKMRELKKICALTEAEISEKLELIHGLNPKPGRNFSAEQVRVMTPDIFVKRDIATNRFIATFNKSSIPEVALNEEYFSAVKDSTLSSDDKTFCKEHMQKATSIVSAINQRNNTLVKVASFIAEEQFGFFSSGISSLKPMTLKYVAEHLGYHESTISRVSNKVIGTDFGIFSIKFFFTSGLRSTISENIYSNSSIKHQIKSIIQNENTGSALSDSAICNILCGNGIKISRRTVTKYREAMKIPSSQHRS